MRRPSDYSLMEYRSDTPTMFEPTIPFGEPELMRVSAFQRYLDDLAGVASGPSSRPGALSPSLMADLKRVEESGRRMDVLEVIAACIRHMQRVMIHLQSDDKVLPLTVFAQERLVHCPLEMHTFLASRLSELRVLHVEAALLRPPGDAEVSLVADLHQYHPLGPLLWELSMRGTRDELLPEIAGPAAYRVAPSLDLQGIALSGSLRSVIERLRRQTTGLRELSTWPGLDRVRAARLLNALYLHAGLIVSRSHPDAVGDSWFGGLGR
jgi:hypothetical protein